MAAGRDAGRDAGRAGAGGTTARAGAFVGGGILRWATGADGAGDRLGAGERPDAATGGATVAGLSIGSAAGSGRALDGRAGAAGAGALVDALPLAAGAAATGDAPGD